MVFSSPSFVGLQCSLGLAAPYYSSHTLNKLSMPGILPSYWIPDHSNKQTHRNFFGFLPHSSTLAWKIPWTEEPGRLQPMRSIRVAHDWATSLSIFTSCIGEGNGNPLQYCCLENPRDRGAWWAAICGVAQSWTRLKRLSSSRSSTHKSSSAQSCSLLSAW